MAYIVVELVRNDRQLSKLVIAGNHPGLVLRIRTMPYKVVQPVSTKLKYDFPLIFYIHVKYMILIF